MLGLPQPLPLTRLPLARASTRRMLLNVPNLTCSLSFHWTLPPRRPQALTAQPVQDGNHPPSHTCSFSFLGLSPWQHSALTVESETWESIPGLAPFHLLFPTFVRSCPCFFSSLSSLDCLSTQVLHPPPWGRLSLLPHGCCSQGDDSRTHNGLCQPLLPVLRTGGEKNL